MKRLLVDIASHGYGHLAQTAPLLNALAGDRTLRLAVRNGMAREQLARRIQTPSAHIHEASAFGFAIHDALNVDLVAGGTAQALRLINGALDGSDTIKP